MTHPTLLLRAIFSTVGVCALLLLSFVNSAAAQQTADPFAKSAAAMECAALRGTDFSAIPDGPAYVMSAKIVEAKDAQAEYCQVNGYVQPQIQFEMRLPTKTWNGRYFQTGCGGFCGMIPINSCNDALGQDFAVAAHNMGHVSGQEGMWGADPMLRIDYGKRSTHVVAVAAKVIVEKFYGKKPAYSYFRGCSTGGREGLQVAINYPDDFDGIVAGDPAYPGRQGGIANNWIAHQLNTRDGEEVFSPETLDFLHAAAIKSCDALDGVSDGIIADPRACDFKPSSLACAAGHAPPACLTPAQVEAADLMYDGPRNSKGTRLYPGWVTVGSEISWKRGNDANYATQYLRYMGFKDVKPASYTYWDFDFDKDMDGLKEMVELYDPTGPFEDPDLRAFEKRGGKLIVYHGWADLSVSPITTLDFYAEVAARQGGIESLQKWYRVFMVPGMNHCRGGGVPDRFDMLSAIMAWVEKGTAPDSILARQMDGENVVRSRPLVPYPMVAKYKGSGDVNDAANWSAAKPEKTYEDDIDWIWEARK